MTMQMEIFSPIIELIQGFMENVCIKFEKEKNCRCKSVNGGETPAHCSARPLVV